MKRPNFQLETILRDFATGSSADPHRARQLRAAVEASELSVRTLNAAAAAGIIRSFDIDTSGLQANYVGRFNPERGSVSIPHSAFLRSGASPSVDLVAICRVQSMLVSFASGVVTDRGKRVGGASPEMVTNLQRVLNESPRLANEIKRASTTEDAADTRHFGLEKFELLPSGANLGGAYVGTKHAMLLPGDDLVAHPRKPFHSGALTFVVGHEIEHAFNRAETLRAERAFSEDLRRLSQSSSPIHDYTPVLAQYLGAVRRDEALGQIAGWNAVHSKLEATGHPVTVKAMGDVHHRMRDFVPFSVDGGPATVHPDIVLNADITMSPTPGNIEAMGKHYFDRPPRDHMPPGGKEGAMGLNYDHVSNYPNHYGKNAIERILAAEEGAPLFHGSKPEVPFDMAKLGLYEDVLERQGLDLTKSYGNGLYFDSSQLPSAPRRFDHTVEGKDEHKYVPIAPDSISLPTQLNHPAHPDHEFFQQIRAHVVELDRSLGRGPDHHTDNISSALAVQARTDGIKRVDRIELSHRGDTLSAIQEVRGEPGQFFDLTSHVPTAEANTSMEQSAAKWPEAMQQFEGREKIRAESQQRPADREETVSVGLSQSMAEPERRTHPIHDPRNPDNRHHALYKELERRLPESSDARMMQFTAACHRHRIKANDLSGVHMDYDSMTLTLDSVGFMATPAQVDMSLPPPEPEQSVQQMRQFDQWMEQMQQQSQQHAQAIQQGPAM